MTSRNDVIAEKRDLHVGGLGAAASAGFSTLIDPANDSSGAWTRARDLARGADDVIHDNPWTAVGVGALIGVVAGYLLSRRS